MEYFIAKCVITTIPESKLKEFKTIKLNDFINISIILSFTSISRLKIYVVVNEC